MFPTDLHDRSGTASEPGEGEGKGGGGGGGGAGAALGLQLYRAHYVLLAPDSSIFAQLNELIDLGDR